MPAGFSVIFLSPLGLLLAVGVLVPLGAMALVSRRAGRLRTALGVSHAPRSRLLAPTLAAAAVAALFGVAAAQPVAERKTTLHVRTDAEVYMVLDVSRSMLARTSPSSPSRLARAKVAARKLRASLVTIPVGVASLTDRVLPHLFPSADEDAFRATVDVAVGIERPPPRSSFLTKATNLDSLTAMSSQRFFSPRAKRRVLVVLTDGESQSINGARLARFFRLPPGVGAVFVHVWGKDERVFTRGVPEPEYRPDPGARAALEGLARTTGADVYGADRLDAASRQIRSLLRRGPTITQGRRTQRRALAPYVLIVAVVPLVVLLWRRDR